MDYREAGVDVEEGYRAVEKYRALAEAAKGGAGCVLNGIGGFAGLFALKPLLEAGAGMRDPVLACGTDGVGTKLDIAFRMKKYDTVGIDCVAMCVNDVLCHGARPVVFLDYLACGKLDADVAGALVGGVAAGCRETGTALLGGETAEMPGFYGEGVYDLAGFAVGIAERSRLVDGSAARPGDALLGLASSGAHSNGFSLIRRVCPDLDEDFGGMPLGLALLEPTRLYVRPVLALMEEVDVRGMAHITGGGFYENVPRLFPRGSGLGAAIRGGAWEIPPLFARIAAGAAEGGAAEGVAGVTGGAAQRRGAALLREDARLRRLMFGTFNMGIGFVLAVPPGEAGRAREFLDDRGYPAWEIGRVTESASGGLCFE